MGTATGMAASLAMEMEKTGFVMGVEEPKEPIVTIAARALLEERNWTGRSLSVCGPVSECLFAMTRGIRNEMAYYVNLALSALLYAKRVGHLQVIGGILDGEECLVRSLGFLAFLSRQGHCQRIAGAERYRLGDGYRRRESRAEKPLAFRARLQFCTGYL